MSTGLRRNDCARERRFFRPMSASVACKWRGQICGWQRLNCETPSCPAAAGRWAARANAEVNQGTQKAALVRVVVGRVGGVVLAGGRRDAKITLADLMGGKDLACGLPGFLIGGCKNRYPLRCRSGHYSVTRTGLRSGGCGIRELQSSVLAHGLGINFRHSAPFRNQLAMLRFPRMF